MCGTEQSGIVKRMNSKVALALKIMLPVMKQFIRNVLCMVGFLQHMITKSVVSSELRLSFLSSVV